MVMRFFSLSSRSLIGACLLLAPAEPLLAQSPQIREKVLLEEVEQRIFERAGKSQPFFKSQGQSLEAIE